MTIETRTVVSVQWPDRRRVTKDASEGGRAQQHFKEETDINVIVDRWMKTGQVPDLRQNPAYGDFSLVPDFQTALNQIEEANRDFMRLPAELRKRFDNSPAEMLAWLEDPLNLEEARELGLLPPAPPAPPPPAPVATSTSAVPAEVQGSAAEPNPES